MSESQLPLSFAQEQLWFIDEFHRGLAAHNLPNLIRLRGPLDVPALRRALDRLVARHEPLRTRFVAGQDSSPAQVIDPPAPVPLDRADRADPRWAAADGQLGRFASTQSLRLFELGVDAPLRACLIALAAQEHALLIVVHQTAFDQWSLGVLVAELAALYRAEVEGSDPGLAELPTSFASHACRERQLLQGSVLDELEAFWRDALGGFETSQFPADRPRPVLASHDGAVESIKTGPDLLDGLHQLSRSEGTTLQVILLAALLVLLHRYTGQTDLVVGTVSANRSRAELAPLIGFLASNLPIRADLSGDPSFAELLSRVSAVTESASRHQDLAFAKIVEALQIDRDPGRFPVFQVDLACTEPVPDVESAGVIFHRERVDLPAARYDIGFVAEPGPDGLGLHATYTPALFDAGTVQRLLGHFEVLLRGVVADPLARVSQLPVLTEGELERELRGWNDTAAEFPVVCIHRAFEAQAGRAPGAVAAEFGAERVSYAELNGAANRIARRLRGLGVGPEVLVGVCMAAGVRRLAALLGVWKAGGGYVPLDPGLPADRLSFMIGDTGMAVVLADEQSAGSVPAGVAVVSLDAEWAAVGGLDGGDLPDLPGAGPGNVAYVIYTSGSTGQPKGVVVEHRQAVNFLQGMIGAWRIGPSSAVLQFAAFTFDVSVMDMFMPLLAGARVVLAPAATLHSPPRLAALMRSAKVTFACLPPAVLNLLTGEQFPDLQTLLSAGDELSSDLLRSWLRDGLEIYNGYGPTEASIGSTFMKLDADTPLPPPIGRPKPNYRAYVLDRHLNPVPAGVIGELHIGGRGVARGYLNRPELTAERFIADPFVPGQRLYKSGDLVRRRPDGTIVFVGRIDNQVKVRGLRIELGEIESALVEHPAVAQAVAVVLADAAGQQLIAAYLRPRPGVVPEAGEVRRQLAGRLPGYMVPGALVVLDEFPLTTNGKVDKAALPAPEAAARRDRVPPRTLIETVLVDLYATVLGHEQVGAADSFFDAGGNSLQAMQLISRLRSALAVDLDVSAVFLAPSPQQLAALLRDEHGFEDADLTEEDIDGVAGLSGQPADEVPTASHNG